MTPYWFNSTLAALPAILWMIGGVGIPVALALLPRKRWRDTPLVAMTALAMGPALITAWMFVLGTIGGARADALGLSPRTPDPAGLLSLPTILIGSAVVALLCMGIAWRKWRRGKGDAIGAARHVPLAQDERLLVWLIGAALVLRFLVTAYWNFTAYDTLWVYGYQGRLYALLGYIPTSIGYYPPFVQLQYTFAQLGAAVFTGQTIDDHAARAVIMIAHVGSVLAAYTLGKQVFNNRRVGIFAAALWALYPHVGEWAQVGDLEIPLTFAFTAAAAFFLKGWLNAQTRTERLHAGMMAGLFLGVALWTKPTAGAFILGVAGLFGLECVRVAMGRFTPSGIKIPASAKDQVSKETQGSVLARFKSPFRDLGFSVPDVLTSGKRNTYAVVGQRAEVVLATALACLPLGGAWYLRNLAYGHPPITLPNPFWLTQALRSGAEFGFPLLALGAVIAYTQFAPLPAGQRRPDTRLIAAGIVLIALGILPTIITPYLAFNMPNRMDTLEWVALIAGVGMIAAALQRSVVPHLSVQTKRDAIKVVWALLLALPYFVTWFHSYSYHYRLSFPIVPLMILPTAVLLAHWTRFKSSGIKIPASAKDRVSKETQGSHVSQGVGTAFWLSDARNIVRFSIPDILTSATRLYPVALLLIALPGVFITLHTYAGGWDWLWRDPFPTEFRKQDAANGALAWTVKRIKDDLAAEPDQTAPLVIVAPGLQRLPFFFPLDDVRIETAPTALEALDDADYFIHTQEAAWYYPENDLPLLNPVLGSLRRPNVMEVIGGDRDASFWSLTARVRPPDRRFDVPRRLNTPDAEVRFGDFAVFAGHRFLGDDQSVLQLLWRALQPAPGDYTVFVHLIDMQGEQVASWEGKPAQSEYEYGYYATTFWQPGEVVMDERRLNLPENLAPGEYRLAIGFYGEGRARVPVLVGGDVQEAYTLTEPLIVPEGK